jgi:peptide/nickel transport system substrate-binding protein
MWNAEKSVWESVPEGTEATSRVVFDYSRYFQANWHHGQAITMADVLYSIYSAFDQVYNPDKSKIEFVTAAVQRPLLDTFRGIRVLDENRLEVYLDFWHFEEAYIASYASLTSLPLPWEIMAAMDELVFEKRMAAYSQSAAARFNVPWFSLVMSSDAALAARALREFQDKGFIPENIFTIGGKDWVSPGEAELRYQASLDWYDEYQHLVISQGPFYIVRYDPPAQYAELLAFRDSGYSFKPGDWYFGRVESFEFTGVEESEGMVRVQVQGPGKLGLDYVIFDLASGQVEETGQAKKIGEGQFEVSLEDVSGRLVQVYLLAYSDQIAVVKEKEVQIR